MSRLKQPGAPLQPRRLAAWASGVTDLLITLPAGADLMTGLVEALADRGIEQAGLVLLSGELRAASFMTGRPDVSGHRIATHAGPWDLAGPLRLLGGNAILGRGASFALLHCHAVFATPEGRLRGGHLRPGHCPLGPGGLRAPPPARKAPASRWPRTARPIFRFSIPSSLQPAGPGRCCGESGT